jgi:DNA N-6-adenine-methyltransferase Dam
MTVHEKPWGDTREWFTPPELFDALGLRFDLDPASPMSGPVPWVPAGRFYSPRENGLTSSWTGRVWLNPPYGPSAVAFVQRMAAHQNGMLLVPARTETRWFQHAAHEADRVTFLRERLYFIRADGFRGRSSHASVLMAYGQDCADALRRADLGWTVDPWTLSRALGRAGLGAA